jgi:hypothetical protein
LAHERITLRTLKPNTVLGDWVLLELPPPAAK